MKESEIKYENTDKVLLNHYQIHKKIEIQEGENVIFDYIWNIVINQSTDGKYYY